MPYLQKNWGENVIMRNHHSRGYSTHNWWHYFFCFFSVTTWSHSAGRVRRSTPVLLSLTSSVHDFFCWPVSTADTYDSSWWMTVLSLHARKYHTASSLMGRATCTISQQRIFSTNIFTGIQVLVRWRTTTLQNRMKYGTTRSPVHKFQIGKCAKQFHDFHRRHEVPNFNILKAESY